MKTKLFPILMARLCLTSQASAEPTPLKVANPNLNVPSSPPATSLALVNTLPGVTFSQPVCLRTPPAETKRLFVCEKIGLIKVVPDVTATTPSATVFLDLTNRTQTINIGSECGLLGLAFHPQYATNRYFYVFYSVNSTDGLEFLWSEVASDAADNSRPAGYSNVDGRKFCVYSADFAPPRRGAVLDPTRPIG